MKKIILQKRGGGSRTIYAPGRREKARLRLLVPAVTELSQRVCNPDVVHGFMPGKSPVTNARKHVGQCYTLSADLSEFFDTVTLLQHAQAYAGLFSAGEMQLMFYAGAARQGLPTSPAWANVAAPRRFRAPPWRATSGAQSRSQRNGSRTAHRAPGAIAGERVCMCGTNAERTPTPRKSADALSFGVGATRWNRNATTTGRWPGKE